MRRTTALMMLALLAGCSTKPRDFRPNLAVAPVNPDVQMRDFAVCKMMVDRGIRGNYAKQAAVLTPGAVGATTGAVFAGIATSTAIGNGVASALSGGTAATTSTAGATALSAALPIVGAAASVAIAASVKHGNEKKVKSALGACMKEYGHDVTTWQRDRSKVPTLPAELPRDPAKP